MPKPRSIFFFLEDIPLASRGPPHEHGGDSYAFGSSAMSQANDYFFARKRESFLGRGGFARKREKNVGVFFFGIFGVFWCFGGICFCFSRVSAEIFGFIFRDEPSKAGSLRPAHELIRSWGGPPVGAASGKPACSSVSSIYMPI